MNDSLERRKRIIFFCGVLLLTFTSMSKVLVPGTMFSELQRDLGLSASSLGAMGAGFMYCYAVSQLALGVLSTRYGGVRILLFGAGCFTAGCILFPCLHSAGWMIFARSLTGLGAGTVFIGVAKLIADLYPEKFSIVLGCVLFVSYFGPVAGGYPMISLIRVVGWRFAMGLVAAAASLLALVIVSASFGTLKKPVPGQTFRPLFVILRSFPFWCLSMTSSFIYGTYYAIMTTLGKKTMEDCAGMSSASAAVILTVLSIIVACNNIVANAVMNLLGGKRKTMVIFSGISHTVGILLLLIALTTGNRFSWLIPVGFVVIAIPAGFFSIFSTVAKELNPPEYVGLAVAILNCFAFILIALSSNLAGWTLSTFETGMTAGLHYPPEAYRKFFLLMLTPAVIGMISAFFVPETFRKGDTAQGK